MPSVPAYPFKRRGTVIVCGAAPCLPDDLERALRLRPGVPLIAVNGASMLVEAADVVTLELATASHWREKAKKQSVTIHSLPPTGWRGRAFKPEDHPEVDYFWPSARCAASSGWGAVRVAKGMGFSEVIMAGCPFDWTLGYAEGVQHAPGTKPVLPIQRAEGQSMMHRRHLVDYVRQGEGEGVRSMSGFTAELLGVPDA